jgi:excisionase family DNA binding protein
MAVQDSPLTSPLLGIQQVAHLLGVEVRHVRRLVAERRIPYVKWGHLLRFDPAELRTWIDEHRLGATSPAERRRADLR